MFFFTVITEGIAVIYLAHTGGDTGQITKGFCKTGLATAAMARLIAAEHVANAVRGDAKSVAKRSACRACCKAGRPR